MKEVQVWDGDGVDREPEPEQKVHGPRECTSCGRMTPYAEATLFDPFEKEVHGKDVPVWLCEPCAYENQRDV